MSLFRSLFHFLLFSSIYIACCAVLMVHQTIHLLHLPARDQPLLYFVFFATLCSYNFHWYFTPLASNERIRSAWTEKNRLLHLILAIAGGAGALFFYTEFIDRWVWILPSVVLTFLYTAPKIPHPLFGYLKKIAVAKTIYLSFVWTYVTTALPILLYGNSWTAEASLFCISRFFLVYAICILFDYRDREQDKQEGIRSLITYFNEKGIKRLFFVSLIIFVASTFLLLFKHWPLPVLLVLLFPGMVVAFLYPIAKRNYSDYLYYFVLDGMMMFSSLCTVFFSF